MIAIIAANWTLESASLMRRISWMRQGRGPSLDPSPLSHVYELIPQPLWNVNGLLILVVQAKQRHWLVDLEGDSSDMMFVWWKLKVLISIHDYFKLFNQRVGEYFKWLSQY